MSPSKNSTSNKQSQGFTAEEKAAMKARAKELKMEAENADAETAVVAAIAELAQPDRRMAERFHAIVKANAPELKPKLWYGMPAYAKDGNVICFFQAAAKFKAHYATIGFNDKAHLDDGSMWPVAFALTELTPAEEARLTELVKKAAG